MLKQQKSGSLSNNPILISSPLQGITDFRFRNTFQKFFGGIDIYYAPYIRLNSNLQIKPAYQRDILPENNYSVDLVPQVMTKDTEEFLFVANYVQKLGYKELNWNLGCPYPMLTKRGMGSGLIKNVVGIEDVLKRVYSESDVQISIKIRLGYESNEEILRLLPVLDKYPLKGIGIHARLGMQMYKGDVDLEGFRQCIKNTKHILYYNGDINSVTRFREMQNRFPEINHWMLGRGLIADPFLPGMIKSNSLEYPENRIELFSSFHDTLFQEYAQALSGAKHRLQKMYQFWEYFIYLFPGVHKGLKKIKKAKTIAAYENAVKAILDSDTGKPV